MQVYCYLTQPKLQELKTSGITLPSLIGNKEDPFPYFTFDPISGSILDDQILKHVHHYSINEEFTGYPQRIEGNYSIGPVEAEWKRGINTSTKNHVYYWRLVASSPSLEKLLKFRTMFLAGDIPVQRSWEEKQVQNSDILGMLRHHLQKPGLGKWEKFKMALAILFDPKMKKSF